VDSSIKVNPADGLPIDPKEEKEKKEAKIRQQLEARKAQADRLRHDLESDAGNAVIQKIKQHLLNRIDHLMSQDGECVALKKVLVDMGLTLNMGEVAVNGLMRLVEKNK